MAKANPQKANHLDNLVHQAERQRETNEEITYETKANNARKEN